jgi:ketosteroid isomerase-like protein
VSQENVQVVQRGFAHFQATGDLLEDVFAPEFVWDMSTFDGWPEQRYYEGIDGARAFLRAWTNSWDDWELDIDAFHDAGERVVVIVRQSGRSRTTGMPVDMLFAQVFTVRGARQTRMEMYSDPQKALKAVGLEE